MNTYRLYYKKISHWHRPEEVFLALYADKKYTFWLDNNMGQPDQYSYMGIASKRINYTLSNHTLSISNNNKTKKSRQDIFTYIKYQIQNTKYKILNAPFDFTGGFIGYFGYEMRRDVQNGTSKAECLSPTFTSQFPDAFLFFVDKFLAFDHRQKCLYLVCLSKDKSEADQWLSATKRQLSKTPVIARRLKPTKQSLSITGLPRRSFLAPRNDKNHLTFTPSRSRQQYLKDIRTCQKYLTAGDVYQICLTNQVTANIKTNWLDVYRTLRRVNPAPAGAYINFGNFALLSSSPEQFLKVDKKGCVTSKPMKGTVRRGNTLEEDKYLLRCLGKTKKDYAENIMIVDLVRNDLGKVCVVGSIKVTKPLEAQTYPTVHQLVSTIKGKLRPGATIVDLLKASFPGGSITGAPKIRAMEIIAELENAPRGIYSGAFGFLSLNGAANLAMTIRTIIATKDQLSFGTGGAILTDSIPQEEYNEMLLKTQSLIEAISKTTGAKTFSLNS